MAYEALNDPFTLTSPPSTASLFLLQPPGLLAALQTCHACSHLWAFALTVRLDLRTLFTVIYIATLLQDFLSRFHL